MEPWKWKKDDKITATRLNSMTDGINGVSGRLREIECRSEGGVQNITTNWGSTQEQPQ